MSRLMRGLIGFAVLAALLAGAFYGLRALGLPSDAWYFAPLLFAVFSIAFFAIGKVEWALWGRREAMDWAKRELERERMEQ